MDFLPIAVMILFVLLGGGIAVFADELGRRIGKKRLVLHRRIRPKTTARIITFFAGMTITLLTIILISIVSSDVRVWVREGAGAIKERDRLQADVGRLRKEQAGLENEKSRLTADNRNLTAAEAELLRQVKGLKATLDDIRAKFQTSQGKLQGSQRLVAAQQLRVSIEQKRVTSLNARLVSITLSVQQKTHERNVAEKKKLEAEAGLKVLQGQYRDLSAHETALSVNLQQIESTLRTKQAEIDAKTKDIEAADAAIQKLNADKDRLQRDIDDANANVIKANQDLQTIRGLAENNAVHTRDRPLMFARGEELTRVSIPSGVSKVQARQIIENAMAAARNVAKDHGAKRTERINYADLYEVPDNDEQTPSIDAQKDLLASQLAGAPEEQVLIVISAFNSFVDEVVIVGLAHQANPVVYQPGQALAEVRVDGRQDRKTILEALDGLGSRVRSRAIKDKMIPIQKGDMQLGIASSEDILDLYDQIRASRGSVRVQARARRLTRAADPLLLDFEVK